MQEPAQRLFNIEYEKDNYCIGFNAKCWDGGSTAANNVDNISNQRNKCSRMVCYNSHNVDA